MNTRGSTQRLLSALLLLSFLWVPSSFADDYAERWGPPVGEALPVLDALDHEGNTRRFEDLKGKNGLLLFMNRSADW